MQALKYIKEYLWGSPVEDEAKILEATMVRMMEAIQSTEGNWDELEPITTDMMQQCVKRIGKVELFPNLCGMLDGIQFSSSCERPNDLKSGDAVEYLCYRQDEVHKSQIVKILSKVDDLSNVEELSKTVTGYDVATKMMIAMVSGREGRFVLLGDTAPRFSLDTVKSSFVPEVGDWLSLLVEYQVTEEGEVGEVLGVLEIQTLRTKICEGRVTSWDATSQVGVIDDSIFFSKAACQCYNPKVKDVVTVDALESNQGKHRWRAIRMCPVESVKIQRHLKMDENIVSQDEHQYRLYVTEDVSFGTLSIDETKDLNVEVHNRSAVTYVLKRSAFHVKRSESQLSILRAPDNDVLIKPDTKLHFTFRCSPTFLGYSEELFVFTFNKFSVKRVFKIYIVDRDTWSKVPIMETSTKNSFSQMNKKNLAKHKQQGNMHFIRGIRLKKPPNFMAVRMPPYEIPGSLWATVYKYYDEEHRPPRLEDAFPLLSEELCMDNYKSKFHTMLYLEEVDYCLRMQSYDMERAFMTRQGEFLCLEVERLTEKRPSILPGDSVMVQSLRDQRTHLQEGVIHQIGGSKVFLKFAVAFHQAYNGEDVTVQFAFGRSNFMKLHFAVDQAVKELDKEVLFPDKIHPKPPQVMIVEPSPAGEERIITDLKERKIQWFNHNLNSIQKRAVKNILQGEARPLPYVVFGPPGTGKTLTLVEAVMQMYCLIPESRILIATPSNSSANLLMDRLLETGKFMVGTIMRVLAHHVAMKGNTPEKLKPYCGTLDTALETTNTYNLQHRVLKDGMQLNCKKSNVGRHRITVSTCSTIGSMYRLGFEKGHFTHIVVDEAGQATEPELMTALAFLNKEGGQAVLAGDPMQLGPIIMSTAAGTSGLEESYLERLLNAFPYQRDVEGFKGDLCGYNPCLVTRLIINYRSIPKLLKLPSDMFYDSSLMSQLSEEDEEIRDMVVALHPLFNCSADKNYPGLVFHGIRGENVQAEESPSWFNRHEASTVVMFLAQLYRKNFKPDDIGIITPYIQQIRFMRWLMEDQELECPKIGTVEEFQGQERKIILMSCVRSSKEIVSTDRIQSIGFLRSPKRLNVSLTRAQILLVIFGNPHLLSIDPHWQQVIKYAVQHGGYMGCELPKEFADLQ